MDNREKFRSQDKGLGIAYSGRVKDILAHKAKIKGHHHRADLDNGIIGDDPFKGIILQMHDKVAVLNSQLFVQVIGGLVDFII